MGTLRTPLVGLLFCVVALLPLATLAQEVDYGFYGDDFSWIQDVQPVQLAEDQSLWSDPLWNTTELQTPDSRTSTGTSRNRKYPLPERDGTTRGSRMSTGISQSRGYPPFPLLNRDGITVDSRISSSTLSSRPPNFFSRMNHSSARS